MIKKRNKKCDKVFVQNFILSVKCETLLGLSSTLEGNMANLPPVFSSSIPSDSLISRNTETLGTASYN